MKFMVYIANNKKIYINVYQCEFLTITRGDFFKKNSYKLDKNKTMVSFSVDILQMNLKDFLV